MLPKKEPSTHRLWSQHRERGQFREWYRSGHLWLQITPQLVTGRVFQAMFPRSGDGFSWFFPEGMDPPDPPPEPQRPDSQERTE